MFCWSFCYFCCGILFLAVCLCIDTATIWPLVIADLLCAFFFGQASSKQFDTRFATIRYLLTWSFLWDPIGGGILLGDMVVLLCILSIFFGSSCVLPCCILQLIGFLLLCDILVFRVSFSGTTFASTPPWFLLRRERGLCLFLFYGLSTHDQLLDLGKPAFFLLYGTTS